MKYVRGGEGKRSVEQAAEDMKRAKLLGESTSPAAWPGGPGSTSTR